MTTALPHPTASLRPQPDTRHLHLVADGVRQYAEDPASPPLVGYLLLVPQGTDPLDLFVKDRPRPEFRLVAADMTAEVTAGATAPPPRQPADDAVRIDTARRTAEVDGRELDLTYLEFELLAHLVRRPHLVQSRETLVAAVWGYHHVGDGRTVDVHIARLRRKLGAAHRHRIVTVRSIGYKYVPDQQDSPHAAPCGRS
ncbi:winged helix-turn-helix domain-containing protein [Streptomyces cellulosae]|uniref:Winged helix-turn-helix domain-containing protein n=1 Tax=Streptomyces thermocarboxydus TaxID=59299 RepID=A0ABU3JDY2_9ACTN|nr:winged helix-turn-helix domain-containing protein [Streptomyces thermocarboxydus]